MSDKIELAKKALNLSSEEWEGLGEPAREAILRLCEPDKVDLQDPEDQESRKRLAKGIREVLSLHDDQYDALPRYQRDGLLKKVSDILG